jgi:beta-galactosidase/beta-glucuronidase
MVFLVGLVAFLLIGMGQRPKMKVYVQRLRNGHFRLIVNKKPFIIKGVVYNPIPIGESYDYDWWSDEHKPWMIDGKLMKEMGINSVRFYQPGKNPEAVKKVIDDLYKNFGIYTIMGHWLGFWNYPCPFYGDKDFREKIKEEVLEMVKLYKDQEGLLFWVLGNENNYSFSGQVNPWSNEEIDKEPDPYKQKILRAKIYYSFVNELAKEIKKIDPNHPVALGNGELIGLDIANQYCPDIDIVACIIYRGKTFGNLFNSLKATFNRPIFLSEFGADSYDAYKDKEDQNMQALFLECQWQQIYQNLAGKEGAGNCIGGTVFEWSDEWWKHNEYDSSRWAIHDTSAGWSNPSYYFDIQAKDNKNMNEEWFGIVALSEEKIDGLNRRIPRKSYYVLKQFWQDMEKGKVSLKKKPKRR